MPEKPSPNFLRCHILDHQLIGIIEKEKKVTDKCILVTSRTKHSYLNNQLFYGSWKYTISLFQGRRGEGMGPFNVHLFAIITWTHWCSALVTGRLIRSLVYSCFLLTHSSWHFFLFIIKIYFQLEKGERDEKRFSCKCLIFFYLINDVFRLKNIRILN